MPVANAVIMQPSGGATTAIIADIAAAIASIDVLMYELTMVTIANALIAAKLRGLAIRVILDAPQSRKFASQKGALRAAGVPVWYDAKHQIMHSKYMIIDAVTIWHGSFNWSQAAESRNAEHVVKTTGDTGLVTAFQSDYSLHLAHSIAYP